MRQGWMRRGADGEGIPVRAKIGRWLCRRGWHKLRDHPLFPQNNLTIGREPFFFKCVRPGCGYEGWDVDW